MEYMENADIFKKYEILKEFLVLNVHKITNRELSSNNRHLALKSLFYKGFRAFLLFCEMEMRLDF